MRKIWVSHSAFSRVLRYVSYLIERETRILISIVLCPFIMTSEENKLVALWEKHMESKFVSKDVDETMDTMVENCSL
jgi:hypothetical protein